MTAIELIFHPMTLTVGAALASLVLTYAVKSSPMHAQAVADYAEALERAVVVAEASGLPGAAKAKMALDALEAWLAERGVRGDVKAVTLARAQADLDAVVARLFPPAGQRAA